MQIAQRRIRTYIFVTLGLSSALLLGRNSAWQGSEELHTLMEVLAAFLALIVGIMALLRYYSKTECVFLFIGVGFLGISFLDGFHALVTSTYFKLMMPSDLPALIPWSWVSSRQFLAVMMVLSWTVWKREERLGHPLTISNSSVYWGAGVFTLASFIYFIFVPLPRAYYPEFFFHRPEDFLPALFFLVALIGYLKKGHWRHDTFEHWVILSLIVGVVSQTVFMPLSGQLFDYEFDAAHTLKIVSYVCVLTGLLLNMLSVFRRETQIIHALQENESRLHATVDRLLDGIITINDRGLIQSINPATERIFGHTKAQLLNQNVKMLMPNLFFDAHDGYLQKFRDTGTSNIIDEVREVFGIRANGKEFPMELQISQYKLGDEQRFLGIVRDITERKEMDRLKDEFISTISHELRTPLTVILGYIPLLTNAKKLPEPEIIETISSKMEKSGLHLLDLVNDLLDISTIEAGQLKLDLAEINLAYIVTDVASNLEKIAYDKGLKMIVDVEPCHVFVDETRVRQILINLIGNAVKFTERGQVNIRLVIGRTRQDVTVSIQDSGPGIPEEGQSSVYDRFKQVDGSSTRNLGGTGLGLAISKNLVELHGGEIHLFSIYGEGCTFSFTLPFDANEGR